MFLESADTQFYSRDANAGRSLYQDERKTPRKSDSGEGGWGAAVGAGVSDEARGGKVVRGWAAGEREGRSGV